MKKCIKKRVLQEATYIVKTGATVRKIAQEFGVSKSTVHQDLTERLKKISPIKFRQVSIVIQKNKAERHLRGGMATRKKYQEEKERKE